MRPAHCTGVLSPGPAPLRRLTRTEYNNTARDLLGDDTRPGDTFPPEEETLGFDNNASGRGVTQIHVERYMLAAEALVKAQLVKLRYFAGLSHQQAAETLGLSRATADRHWAYAKSFLYAAIQDQPQ